MFGATWSEKFGPTFAVFACNLRRLWGAELAGDGARGRGGRALRRGVGMMKYCRVNGV